RPHLEGVEFARAFRDLDVGDARPGRPAASPLGHRFDGLGAALQHRLDGAVLPVPHPARHAGPPRLPLEPEAVADALDMAVNEEVPREPHGLRSLKSTRFFQESGNHERRRRVLPFIRVYPWFMIRCFKMASGIRNILTMRGGAMKTNPGRRAVLVAAVSALAAGLPAGAAQPRGGAQQERVVYHINDTEGQAMRAMQYIANHLEVNPAAKIVVVTHAAGVDFLMKGAKSPRGGAYLDVVEPLLLQGVTFMVCEITL